MVSGTGLLSFPVFFELWCSLGLLVSGTGLLRQVVEQGGWSLEMWVSGAFFFWGVVYCVLGVVGKDRPRRRHCDDLGLGRTCGLVALLGLVVLGVVF